ncbi:MAG: PIG-L deacetylase family protein [Candidatus Bathyarchaeia archaeon]
MVIRSNVIIAVGAHPDDIELGCGGTIAACTANGRKVIAVFLTKGEISGDAELRCEESRRALAFLGVREVYFGDFRDAEIPFSRQAIEFLEHFYNLNKPDVVLTHTVNDSHQDHRQVAWLSLSAFRNVPKMLAYETPKSTHAFAPQYYVEITDFIDVKWKALKCHESQGEKRYLAYESMVNLASFRGAQVNVKAAEAFEVVRYLEKTDNLREKS